MGSFLGKILGTDKAAKELAAAKAKADADLKSGYDTGRSDMGGAIDRLDDFSNPAAIKRYYDSLGINGADALGGVEHDYMADPIQNALMDRITKANTRAFTSRGMSNSGAATQSLTNSLLDNWRQYQQQLAGAGQTSLGAATTQSGIQKSMGDMAFGYGSTLAGNDINYGNAVAANKTAGANFLGTLAGNVAGAVAKGAAAFK